MSRKPWTDYELGFLQDHDDWTPMRIAEELGRTKNAVELKRWKVRAGWTPAAQPAWSKDEDDFLLTNSRMSSVVAGAAIGRTAESVRTRRKRLKGRGVTDQSFGGNWSPLTIGARPLLARTCPTCGLLLQAHWFASKSRRWAKVCGRCTYAKKNPQRSDTKKAQVQRKECLKKYQALTLPGASKSGHPWTEADFTVLQDPDLTIMQKALTLHRTWAATSTACIRSGFKSHVGLGDPERDQWIIDNPNAGNVDDIAAALAPLSPITPAEAKQPAAPQWDWDDSDLKVSA